MSIASRLFAFIRPFTRKGWWHWLRFALLLVLAGYAGHVLSTSNWLTGFRYSIYHRQLMMRDRSSLYPERTALVLLDVPAILWDANDASTSKLMSDFYARWVRDAAAGKAEALRQAQLVLLHGSAAVSEVTKADRGFAGAGKTGVVSSLPGYAHPYYWAQFVLTGNYQ